MIEILVGMIASGKSTYARKRAQEDAIIANGDSLVTSLHAGDYTLYDKELKILYKSLEHQIITVACSLGRDVIIDRTNLKRSSRERYYSIAKSLEIPCKVVIFPVESPKEHARRRSESDSRGYDYEHWLKVAQTHFSQWEDVSIEEPYDLKKCIDSL